MLPDRVSNPGHLTYESGALPIALRGPAGKELIINLGPVLQTYTVQPPYNSHPWDSKKVAVVER